MPLNCYSETDGLGSMWVRKQVLGKNERITPGVCSSSSLVQPIHDLPPTQSQKFIYTDDIWCRLQALTFSEPEKNLSDDIVKLPDYLKAWHLQPSPSKTVSSTFNLHHANAKRELNIIMNGQRLKHEAYPVYLGMTFDQTLTNKSHLSKIAVKVRTCNYLFANW